MQDNFGIVDAMDLYVFRLGPTSRAVLAFCDAAHIELTVKDIDLMKGEHRQPPFITLNPNGMLPLLVDGDFVLSESSAILRYLAGKASSPLYPTALRPRAQVDELIAWFEANLYRDFAFQYIYPLVLPNHARGSDEGTRRTVEWGLSRSQSWFSVLDTHYLAGRTYLVGDQLSLADLFGASIVSLGALVGFDLRAYPQVQHWYETVTSKSCWQKFSGPFQAWVQMVQTASLAASA